MTTWILETTNQTPWQQPASNTGTIRLPFAARIFVQSQALHTVAVKEFNEWTFQAILFQYLSYFIPCSGSLMIFDDFCFKSVQVISPVPRIFETKSLMVVQDVVHRVAPQHRLFHHGRVGLRRDLLGAHLDIFTASGQAAQQHGSCEWSPIFWWHQDVEPLWKDMEMVLPCCAKRLWCLTILHLEMEFARVRCARFGASSSHSKLLYSESDLLNWCTL